ncbi:hypothetical protein HMPREF1980_01631 [Actinomyces sp. oral taxon 172 str. F0311]|nr:hypothetical protein HMPREF1980_01631 [Actinomyces sp. oral taxon 172 str. F0311]
MTEASDFNDGQKAPSAKRCIKTHVLNTWHMFSVSGQKAPSAKRCIKTRAYSSSMGVPDERSESTERQKVH